MTFGLSNRLDWFGLALSTAHSLATDFNGGVHLGPPPTQNQHVLPQRKLLNSSEAYL